MARRVTYWQPMRDMITLRQAMDRLFDEGLVRPEWAEQRERAARLPLDAYSTEEEIVILASLPGVKPEDVEITIEGDTLNIKGEIPEPPANVDYILRERGFGPFTRTLTFNIPVQADKAEASFRDGLLTLSVPKAEEIKPRTIKVKTSKSGDTQR
ncbi:MAG: Hsp20/alpha crystallin family protein [Chloroflexi bacterium]|nr:Hsp20/alpha crystallin family protein [Chloroflexota bacterium]